MPILICATRSKGVFGVLKSARIFSRRGVEPVRHREVAFSAAPSDLLLVLGCVAAAVLGMTTCTISHSKASCFSCLLLFLELLEDGVCVLIHSLTSDRTEPLYESLSSHLTRSTLRYGVRRRPGIWCRRWLPIVLEGIDAVSPCSVEAERPPKVCVWKPSSIVLPERRRGCGVVADAGSIPP